MILSPDLLVLSPRERQVLQAVSEGKTTAAIGDQLGISPRTVEVHRIHAVRKLGCESVAHAACEAIRKMIIK